MIIICSHEFDIKWNDNIRILNDYAKTLNMEVDYCGISNKNDFHHYETIITFKYKIINTKLQLSKICDFITDYRSELDYDWYIKTRPDIQLLDPINFDILSTNAINGRARKYSGPLKIKYGMSVNGKGPHRHIGDCTYSDKETLIELDDMIYIFSRNIVILNAFDKIEPSNGENESVHTKTFISRNVPLNIIGINLVMTKYGCYSGHLNMIY